MRYLSVCSGIEAATVAWHPLGWWPWAFAEIDKFPSAVLAHHYPDVPNLGDMTTFQEWPDAAIDLLVGGTPCQSFSVAGLRAGLADPRGNLALTYLALADKYRPRWVVWENVPGVLSSGGGRDFGAFLGGLGQLGYGFAYRVLDAQYFGLAQRRARVFVVGHLGDWRRAAAVLFERESLSGHPAPRREAGEEVAGTLASRARSGSGVGPETECPVIAVPSTGDISHCLNAGGMWRIDYETETLIAHSLRADGFDASEDGTGRGTPLAPMAWIGSYAGGGGDVSHVAPCLQSSGGLDERVLAETVRSHPRPGSNSVGNLAVTGEMAVRRLTPRECERLQGFPASRETVILQVCSDPQSGSADVALSCHRSLSDVSPVDGDVSPEHAVTAGDSSPTDRASRAPHVLARVRTQSVGELLELRSHGKLIWSAECADASGVSRRPIEAGNIAAAVVQHLPVLVREIQAGRAGSPANIRLSIPAVNGGPPVARYGVGSAESASGASSDAKPAKFTTSDLGRLIPQDGSIAATSLCSVLAAISGCIPSETLTGNFSAEIHAEIPYTLIPYRGKPAADGPRYKALGNSMAVPVMAWIGRRIQLVEDVCREAVA